jgi:hypothetical protein
MNGNSYGSTNQYYKKKTFGSTSETNLNFGFNFSNKFYMGVNIGMMNVWNKVEENYAEEANGTFNSGFSEFEQYYHPDNVRKRNQHEVWFYLYAN